MKSALYFVYVWPEPISSAAGIRTVELLSFLSRLGYSVTVISPATENSFCIALQNKGFRTITLSPNDSSMDSVFREARPQVIFYDRFVMEEQFGWKMRELFPSSTQVVDTQDLHFVRRTREKWAKNGASLEQIKEFTPVEYGDDMLRELSSILRSDVTLVVSKWELQLLKKLEIPNVHYLPFSVPPLPQFKSFSDRTGMAFIGNFRHPPNLDSIRWLTEELWPRFHALHPEVSLYLYGAYPPASISSLHKKNGIIFRGQVEEARMALQDHLCLLSPLRYGAGIKGKVLDSWASGTPILGTPITFEGMDENTPVFTDIVSFSQQAEQLLFNENYWIQAQKHGLECLKEFEAENIYRNFSQILENALEKKEYSLITTLMRHNNQNSYKYFSRWIEEKNKYTEPLVNGGK